MAWVTPKTNWTENDYFNLEDAARITGNLKYLKEKSLELFPDTSISLLLYRETKDGYKWYINMPINISNLTIYDYYRGDTNFAENESYNWYACLVLSALWWNYYWNNYTFDWFSADGPNKAAIDYYNLYGAPRYWYTGYGVLINDNDDVHDHTSVWYRNYLFSHYFYQASSKYPFELEFGNDFGTIFARRNLFSYPLGNTLFWIAGELNSYERTIANINSLINEYGG